MYYVILYNKVKPFKVKRISSIALKNQYII